MYLQLPEQQKAELKVIRSGGNAYNIEQNEEEAYVISCVNSIEDGQ